MSGEAPLDLRSLADVDSPEVVREALRHFRRRVLTRGLWLAVGAVVLVVAVVWGRTPTTLADRIDRASRSITAHPVWRVDDGVVALDRVADLGDDRLGFHFIVVGRGVQIDLTGAISAETFGPWDWYVEIAHPDGRIPTLTIVARGKRSEIELGPGSGVPEAVWRL